MSEEFLVVLSTAASRAEGECIATTLVEESLAACVNIVDGCRSVYRWEGKIVSDDEALLVIKSSLAKFPELERRLIALHTYDVPEIIGIPAGLISEGYLRFLRDTLST